MRNNRLNAHLGFLCAVALTCAVTLDADTVFAQGLTERVSVGLGGGFSQAGSQIGYHALATLELPLTSTALRLRAEGLLANWGTDRASALTGNLLLAPVSRRAVFPYAIAGAGGYAQRGGGLELGWNLGLGLRLSGPARSVFLESRLHTFRGERRDLQSPNNVTTGWKALWTPIGVGMQF